MDLFMNSAFKTPCRRARFIFMGLIATATVFAMTGSAFAAPGDPANDPCRISSLTPASATNPVGTVHTVTATVTRNGTFNPSTGKYDDCYINGGAGPVGAGWKVDWQILTGPNAGSTGWSYTDANGQATFQWSSGAAGTDELGAQVVYEVCPEWWYFGECDPEDVSTDTALPTYHAMKTWVSNPPPTEPPVTQLVDPKVEISVSKKCVKRKFKVKSKNSGSYNVTKSTLYVDGKKVKSNKSGNFTIDTGRYSGKTHRFKVVTTFSNGTKITKSGTFKLCKSRLTSRRLDPNFTG